jgi:hypothetical protein
MGSTSLGTRYYPTPAYWGTGVQIKGVVWPNFFSDSITVRREVLDWMVYYNTVLVEQNAPPIRDDTSFPQLRDDYPQSGGSAGMVYDLDAPGIKKSGPPYQTIYRVRYNFRQWAVLNSRSLVVSPIDLYWYSRVSILHRETGDQLNTDVPGDNVAGVGRTNTTWDLHPQ